MARILVVDDDESDRLIVDAILGRAGHEIHFARDGREALEECRIHAYDIVVTDLQMPEVHGFELISALREMPSPPPIIAVSGTGPYQLEIADVLGAKFTFGKPIDAPSLLRAVDQLLRFTPTPRV